MTKLRRKRTSPNEIHPNALHRLRWMALRSKNPPKRGGIRVVATTYPEREEKPGGQRDSELLMDASGSVYFSMGKRGTKPTLLFTKEEVDGFLHNYPKPRGYEY